MFDLLYDSASQKITIKIGDFEISKHHSLQMFRTAQGWQKQGRSATEIAKLLDFDKA